MLLLLATVVAGAASPAIAPAAVTITRNDADLVAFQTAEGRWLIAKRCLGTNTVVDGVKFAGRSAGPGYIYRAIRLVGGTEARITEETDPVTSAQHPGRTPALVGLGVFGVHIAATSDPARDFTFFDMPGQVGKMNGNVCWDDPSRPTYANGGVTGAQIVEAPAVVSGVGHLTIDVMFGNNEVNPLFTVRYVYRIRDSVVNVWQQITTFCNYGNCVGGKRYYVKEPKVVASANGVAADYTRVSCWREGGGFLGHWFGTDPETKTGQCSPDTRARVLLDFRTDQSATSPVGCPAGTNKCLSIIARGYLAGADFVPGNITYQWEDSPAGMDHWAVRSYGDPNRGLMTTQDDPSDGEVEQCGTPYGDETLPPDNRRWELTGYNPNDLGYRLSARGSLYALNPTENKLVGPVARVGGTESYYGAFGWATRIDWRR